MQARKFAYVQINAQNKEKNIKTKDAKAKSIYQLGLQIQQKESKPKKKIKTRVSHKNSNSCMTPGGQLLKLKKCVINVVD